MSSPVATRGWIGRSLSRVEDERFLTGEAQYVGDMALPGMLHAAFVRSLLPRGRPGVRAVLVGAEVADLVDPFPMVARDGAEIVPVMHPVLARDRVRYVGEPVAVVVADTAAQAVDAAELVT